jgi:hypothetical protein
LPQLEDLVSSVESHKAANIFEPYSGYYTKEELKVVMAYFDAHRDPNDEHGNVEEQHAQMALDVIRTMFLENPKCFSQIEKGVMAFLNAQSKL